jgi:parallel beta-helix repeat protein
MGLEKEQSVLMWKDGSNVYHALNDAGTETTNADFKTLIQGFITALSDFNASTSLLVKLAPGIFDVQSVITISNKYNVRIEGAGPGITKIQAGASLASGVKIFDVKGSVSGTGKNLTVNGAIRQSTVTMSSTDAATFTAGDMVLLRSGKQFGLGGSASGDQGEIKQVLSVSGGVVTFTTPLYDAYNTVDVANVIKLTMARNITFDNFTIGKHASYTDFVGDWVKFFLVDNVQVNNLLIEDSTKQFSGPLFFQSCIHVRVSDVHLKLNIGVAIKNQYGISFHSACQQCTVTNCTSIGPWRHPFEAGAGETGTNEEGVCRGIIFEGCTAMDGEADPADVPSGNTSFDTHPEGEGIIFQGCASLGTRTDRGVRIRSRRSQVNNCFIRNSVGEGIGIRDDGCSAQINDCIIVECGTEGILIQDGLNDISIHNCQIYNCVGNGIKLETLGTDGSNSTAIRDCLIKFNDADGIDITNADNCIIANNIIKDNGAWGIDFSTGDCTNNIIIGNHFSNNTSGSVSDGAQTGNVNVGNFGF